MNEKIVGIIPARYDSSRFPGKPLALIHGKSLIQHTFDKAKQITSLNDLVVATDDVRIYDHVVKFGGKAMMTSPNHPSGSERLAEAAKNFTDATIFVNIQGDEPCIDPETVEKTIQALIDDKEAVMSTATTPLHIDDAENRSIVKCVVNLKEQALYFSRSLIPGSKNGSFDASFNYRRHIGLYVYRREFLFLLPNLTATPLATAEDLEQLKVLEHGYKISVIQVAEAHPGVDLPEDIAKIEKILCQ